MPRARQSPRVAGLDTLTLSGTDAAVLPLLGPGAGPTGIDRAFSRFASRAARILGSPYAFALCVLLIAGWAATGPAFGFSSAWQLVINTGTTIVTFLMVFLIQNTQNRDSLALQTKIDELILTSEAENEFIGIERLTDRELEWLHARCAQAAALHHRVALLAEQEISTRRAQPNGPAA